MSTTIAVCGQPKSGLRSQESQDSLVLGTRGSVIRMQYVLRMSHCLLPPWLGRWQRLSRIKTTVVSVRPGSSATLSVGIPAPTPSNGLPRCSVDNMKLPRTSVYSQKYYILKIPVLSTSNWHHFCSRNDALTGNQLASVLSSDHWVRLGNECW